ncbi:MAG: ROK family protein [Alphaproteobacteria bacterium]|nr:MAG: ROK family protein [Alphaproteobacteria bacterium]
MSFRFGIDLGGTKIESIALDARGQELARNRTATPKGDYQATLKAIVDHVHRLQHESASFGKIGIGIPGTLDPDTGLVKNANSTWLNGKPLDKDLEKLLQLQVRIANDANCFALSEATDGAGKGADVVLGIILGTGCGSGIVAHGRILTGPNAIAGEWGHNALPRPREDELPGPACFCGNNGCIETWLSGTGLAARFAETTGRDLTAEEICNLADEGDLEAEVALSTYEDRFARALAATINILDPDVIVLGGGMSNVDRFYTTIPSLLEPYVLTENLKVNLVKHHHGDSSGVRGAAWLWPPAHA